MRSSIRKISRKAAVAFLLLVVWMVLQSSGFASEESPAPEAGGSQVVRLSLESAETGIKMPFLVYLPEGYGGGEAYPVWYALHSYTTSETMWLDTSGVGRMADEMIARGELRPMIMVFPRTRYDSAKAIQEDMKDGVRDESGMGRFLTKELIPYVDAHFDTDASPEGRFIGGFSMGGYFALEIAFQHPGLFRKAGAFNPALAFSDFSGGQFEKWLYPDAAAEALSDAAAFARAKGLDKIQVYLDCGRVNDPFSEGTQSLNLALKARGIPVTFSIHDGGHSLQLDKIREYLLFFGGGETSGNAGALPSGSPGF
jgi:enterochelin esterase-like enzyme